MARQEKLKKGGEDVYGAAFCYFARISKCNVVRESQLSESHQCEKANAELGVEQKVIVRAGVIVRGAHGIQIRDSQGVFSDSWCPTQLFATF